jgi:DNA primase
VAASPHLAGSSPLRGNRTTLSRREALILQAVVNHPWLAHDHLEELADLEFRHADTQTLKSILLDLLAHDGEIDTEALQSAVRSQGNQALLDRVNGAITVPAAVWHRRIP